MKVCAEGEAGPNKAWANAEEKDAPAGPQRCHCVPEMERVSKCLPTCQSRIRPRGGKVTGSIPRPVTTMIVSRRTSLHILLIYGIGLTNHVRHVTYRALALPVHRSTPSAMRESVCQFLTQRRRWVSRVIAFCRIN